MTILSLKYMNTYMLSVQGTKSFATEQNWMAEQNSGEQKNILNVKRASEVLKTVHVLYSYNITCMTYSTIQRNIDTEILVVTIHKSIVHTAHTAIILNSLLQFFVVVEDFMCAC